MNPQGNAWNLLYFQNMKIGKGDKSMTHYNVRGSQVYSHATIDENYGCESSSGQGMQEARNDSGLATG